MLSSKNFGGIDVSDILTALTAYFVRTSQDLPIFKWEQQLQQKDKVITLPLAHACRIKIVVIIV